MSLAASDALLLSPDAHRLVAPFVETEPSTPLTLELDAAAYPRVAMKLTVYTLSLDRAWLSV